MNQINSILSKALFIIILFFQSAFSKNTQKIHLGDQLDIFATSKAFNDSYIRVNADENADMRMTGSTTLLGLVTLPSTAQKILINGLNLVIDSATGNVGVGSASTGSISGGMIVFSSGTVISGDSVLPAAPRLLGFGSSVAATVNGSGESTAPSQVGGFSFPVPFSGSISNLQVSTDLFAISATLLNSTGLRYDFTVLVSPSSPNNGTDHVSSSYVTTTLTASTAFGSLAGSSVVSSTFRSSTNINTGSISVNAGDRVAIRVRMLTTGNTITDGLIAAQVGQISFAASLSYIPN